MVDVKTLDGAIKQLEENAEKVRSVGQLVNDLKKLSKEVEINKESQKEFFDGLGVVVSRVDEVTKLYNDQLDKLLSLVDSVDGKYIEKIEEIRREVSSLSSQLRSTNKRFEDNVLTILQQAALDNKKLYLELEDIVSSKISRMKSDVEVEIRESGKTIKEEVQKVVRDDVNKISDDIKEFKNENKKHFSLLTILIVIMGVLSILNLVFTLLN